YLADYVLGTYGTGAIMAVPGEDQRDWDFATAYGLPIIETIQRPDGWEGEAYTGEGPHINSAWIDGLGKEESIAKAIEWLEKQGIGEGTINFRLRDWLLSRQRFWGCPIPIVYCAEHGAVPVPEDQLPIVAPDDLEFRPTGESPLRYHEGFLHTACPIDGGPALRETDTMDTFVDSSWYCLRFCNPWDDQEPVDSDAVPAATGDAAVELDRAAHRLIVGITDGFDRWSYNTAVAAYMEFVNLLYKQGQTDFALDVLLKLLAPAAPHLTAELWERRHP